MSREVVDLLYDFFLWCMYDCEQIIHFPKHNAFYGCTVATFRTNVSNGGWGVGVKPVVGLTLGGNHARSSLPDTNEVDVGSRPTDHILVVSETGRVLLRPCQLER